MARVTSRSITRSLRRRAHAHSMLVDQRRDQRPLHVDPVADRWARRRRAGTTTIDVCMCGGSSSASRACDRSGTGWRRRPAARRRAPIPAPTSTRCPSRGDLGRLIAGAVRRRERSARRARRRARCRNDLSPCHSAVPSRSRKCRSGCRCAQVGVRLRLQVAEPQRPMPRRRSGRAMARSPPRRSASRPASGRCSA